MNVSHMLLYRLVARRAVRDPALENQSLAIGQVLRAVLGHPDADDAGPPFDLVNEITVLRIAGNHPYRSRLSRARHVDELIVGHVVIQIEAGRGIAARTRVAVDASDSARRVGRFEDLLLHAGEGRLQTGRGPSQLREAFITGHGGEPRQEQQQKRANTHRTSFKSAASKQPECPQSNTHPAVNSTAWRQRSYRDGKSLRFA